MKPKVLVTRRLFDEVVVRLSEHFEVDYHDDDDALSAMELTARLADKNGVMLVLTDKLDAQILAGAPHLKVACNVAVGYNNIDVPACTARGVMATNTPGVLNDTTADMVWALLMASARRVVAADKWTRDGQWQAWRFLDKWLGQDVHHATVGILGMGRIGQAIAKRARGFDMRVIYHNRTPQPDVKDATWVEKDVLFAEADFVVVMVPYSPATHHLIGTAELAQMKPTAHLINVARGGVVDDVALIAALKNRQISGAGLDVFEGEPALNPNFFELDNVTLTPHIGSSTRATRMAMAMCAADNLIAALSGQTPPNLLNPETIKDSPVGADVTPSRRAILLFGHGAKNPEWAAPFVAIRGAILARDSSALVESGFLELMRPTFAEAVDRLVAQGAGEITVVPIFMAAGSHINKDLPLLAAAAMDQHQGVEIKLAPPVGAETSVLNAMADYAMTVKAAG